MSGAVALGLTVSLGACSTLEEALSSPGPAMSAPAGAASTRPTTPTPTVTPTPTEPAIDQSTPEAAMESWLSALVAGEGETVCALMAADGRPVGDLKGAAPACGEALTPLLSSLTELKDMFDGVSIAGATVVDDLATFEAATTKPALAAQVIHRFKAVQIKDKWFVTE
ncbi:hypothetical protein [Intrasporangium sp.]|uniref:hypothetical protein n=1 Tax=Intrasporangium sp. TaxID=1925024 RepID=UPI00293A85D6|nr:hypothetical protein [Intrasporangium sp.]MDV3220035.1 hypothetical protein [Intrasporangium sp.]